MKRILPWLILACLTFALGCVQPSAMTPETPVPTVMPTPQSVSLTLPPTVEPTEMPTPEPTPTATPTPTPTPSPTPSPTPEPSPFTVAVISDTQIYSRYYPDVFNSIRDWILANREKENIVFVAHTGDVVDGTSQFMFDAAAEALCPIFEEISGMIVSGNHDLSKPVNHKLFTFRPYAKLVQKEGQTYRGGEAAYATFSADGTDFLVIGIGYEVYCLNWVQKVIDEHPDHVVIAVMHKALQQDGSFFGRARELYKDIVPNTPQFRLLLCGHMRGTLLRTDSFDDDGDGTPERTVNALMFNYQDDTELGLGYIRLMRFYPSDHRIEVVTYSPWFDSYEYPGDSVESQTFTLRNAW